MNPQLQQLHQQISGIWNQVALSEMPSRKAILESGRLTIDGKTMEFKMKYYGQRPPKGYILVIGMHGGGGTQKSVNDQQYKNHQNLYKFPDGILWLTARAPEDAWNMWHLPYIDKMWDYLIQSLIVCGTIDPLKVYMSGYSAGGDGTYKLSPRMADRLAGGVMCAGHPNGASVLSLRNLPFSIQMGVHDGAYNRNKVAAEYGQLLDAEQAKDPQGYDHFVKIHPNCEHWMKLHDFEGFEWVLHKIRKVFPDRIVWKQCNDVPKRTFYWLVLPPEEVRTGTLIIANRSQNSIFIESNDVRRVGVRLSDYIVNLDAPVQIFFNKQLVHNQIVPRSIQLAEATIRERLDPYVVFTAEVFVSAP